MFIVTFFMMSWTPLCGVEKCNFRHTRRKFGLTELIQIHHIIPRQFRNHPAIVRTGYQIEDGSNYMFMPNKRGKSKILTQRLNHEGGHDAYNRFVGQTLDDMNTKKQKSELLINIRSLAIYLRQQLRSGCPDIPWK
tara:strand:+ start:677 stop:1084 length:408 start_codon:yes stop_codon:yes gene_type:complete